jgi:dihydrofolate synthase/folylpolyglutamate synthase
VGLGGRLDATSTITPHISVITNISRDHTSILGTRIRDIAVEKAGIIKKGVPVVCGCSVRSISHRVIKEIALRNNAPFFNVIDSKNHLEISDKGNFYRCTYTADAADYTFDLHLNGVHQAYNAACAVKTVQVLNRSISRCKATGDTVCKGISATSIPARIEILDTTPQVILDGGHNVESTTALTNFLKEKKKNNLTLVFGVLADKNYRKMIRLLLPYIENVILTEPRSKRALPAREMVRLFTCNAAGAVLVKIINNLEEAYRTARQLKKEILVTGSFYLVGAIRKMIIHNININNIKPGG